MEMNFAFLEKKQEYELFSGACIDAERILESSPVMSAVASRKALELCVKWIYSIDSALEPIGNREGLQSLLHNNGFPSLMDITLWRRLQHIVRNGRHLTGQHLQIRLRDCDEHTDDERNEYHDEQIFRTRQLCADALAHRCHRYVRAE